MGFLLYGYKMNERGRIVHKMFDSDELFNGHGKQEGWVDSPDKVPGAKKAQEAADSAKQATAHTTSPEPPMTARIHGEKRKPGWPKGKPRK